MVRSSQRPPKPDQRSDEGEPGAPEGTEGFEAAGCGGHNSLATPGQSNQHYGTTDFLRYRDNDAHVPSLAAMLSPPGAL